MRAAALHRCDIVQHHCRMQKVKRWQKAIGNMSSNMSRMNTGRKKKESQKSSQLIWFVTY